MACRLAVWAALPLLQQEPDRRGPEAMQEIKQLSRCAGMVAAGPVTLAGGSDPLADPRRGNAVDIPFHGLLEQDRRENARAIKRRAGQHTGPHGMDQVEHLGVGAVAVPPDAVPGQRLGRAATALVKGSEEAAAGPDLLGLGSVPPFLILHHPYRADPAGMTGAMSGAVTAVSRAGRQQAARRRTAPIGPHSRMFKRCGSSPVCVSERNLNTERGKSPLYPAAPGGCPPRQRPPNRSSAAATSSCSGATLTTSLGEATDLDCHRLAVDGHGALLAVELPADHRQDAPAEIAEAPSSLPGQV